MSDDGSPGSALRALTTKLRHSLLDIRERALASLAFKLDNGLLGASDVGRHLPILRALLEWFNFEDTGEKGKDVIEMLRRIATEDPPSVQRLLELGPSARLLLCRGIAVAQDEVGNKLWIRLDA